MRHLVSNASFDETLDLVRKAAPRVSPSLQCAGKVEHELDGSHVYLVVFEKFYMRTNGYISLSVMVTSGRFSTYIDVIGSGGANGLLSNDLGAAKKFEREFTNELTEFGCEETDSS